MTNHDSRTAFRSILITAAATALAALTISTAHAAPEALAGPSTPTTQTTPTTPTTPAPPNTPPTPPTSDLTAANAAATTALPTVAKFFAADGQRPTGTPQTQAAAARQTAPKLDSPTVPVYYLDRAFVAGTTPTSPVASLAFMATDAVSTTGAHASIWTAKTPSGWQVVNIATGSDETAYAAQAGPAGTAFEEPQINAWYTLRAGRVLPLNAPAQTSVGSNGMTVAQYQALVRARYADKLPGSAYDKNGMAGGFDPDTKADTVQQARPLHHPAAAAKLTRADHDNALTLTSAAIAIALLSAGLGYAGYAGYAAYRRTDNRR